MRARMPPLQCGSGPGFSSLELLGLQRSGGPQGPSHPRIPKAPSSSILGGSWDFVARVLSKVTIAIIAYNSN